ncbi:uncharacterized protein LOC106181577 [Lingula anatina]|uniref:Uncharacterized protein LOC106181577 n=1 Tax=Lingula anatina TaxID=7574 RepID=A0A1S3KG74_LINAN|nr:uncharacterized protein LOC106181577 [Lingula anatina]|eukprot:XP_013421464.1 uncharacterized protein LOC106181577 [Lingula anatina]
MTGKGGKMDYTINTAIKRGFFQQVRFLIELGSDVNGKDEDGLTPLILCAMIEEEEWGVGLSRLLLEKGASVGFRDKRGLNALHYACLYQRLELVRVFLCAIDYDLNQGDKFGNTALHYAVSVGNVDITRLLLRTLQKYGMTVDKPNRRGFTPLIQAWSTGRVTCAQILVDEGHADQETADKVEGKTAKEWETEVLAKMNKLVINPKVRRNRPSTASRVSSAPILRRRRPSTAMSLRGNRNAPDNGLLVNVEKTDMLIRSASLSDLRNNPEFVFKLSAVDYFSQENMNDFQPQYGEGYDGFQGHYQRLAVDGNWKGEVKSLLHEFQFQCSPSYRDSIKPPPPRQYIRPTTPPSQLSDGEVPMSDRGSVTGRRSIAGPRGKKLERQTSDANMSRRGSVVNLGPAGRRKNSIDAGNLPPGSRGQRNKRGSVDIVQEECDSSQSGGSAGNKSGLSDSAKASTNRKETENAKLPPRPVSRTGQYRNNIPVVKETKVDSDRTQLDNVYEEDDPNYLSPSRA